MIDLHKQERINTLEDTKALLESAVLKLEDGSLNQQIIELCWDIQDTVNTVDKLMKDIK